MKDFIHEVVLHGIKDTAILLPVLFVTYLLMELAEHKLKGKTLEAIGRAGRLGPLFGGIFGALPQCGFSAAASGLYAGRLISVGTLLAVFLSTSDELIGVMLSTSVTSHENLTRLLKILALKIVCAAVVGFAVDAVIYFVSKKRGVDRNTREIRELCESESCSCGEKGIFFASLIHSLKIFGFILGVTFAINTLIFFVGEDSLRAVLQGTPVVGELIAGLFGLIPNCASSVIITELYLDGVLGASELLSGLFTGAGVGVLILFRTNRNLKENLLLLLTLYVTGVLLGLLIGTTGLASLIGI